MRVLEKKLRRHYENYFGKVRYVVYKHILYKDKEYYDTYDLGKLNSYSNSGEVIKRLFSHKFLEIVHMFTWIFYFLIITYKLTWKLALAMFIPTLLKCSLMLYTKQIKHIKWWRNKKLNENKH